MYKVLLMNDDYTPMDFVVHVLEIFLVWARASHSGYVSGAYQRNGRLRIFPKDIAETKAAQVVQYAKSISIP